MDKAPIFEQRRPAEAFLICTTELQVVYASKDLDSLLRLTASESDGAADLRSLLDCSPVLNAASIDMIVCRLAGSRAPRNAVTVDLPSLVADEPLEVTIQRVGETHWIVCFEDLAARREAERRVVTLTLTDPLTGLGNRTRFRESLSDALDEGQSAIVMLIDLDHFKAVNDTLGHPVGDQLLRKVADRLGTVIRRTDILARLGGDEFAAWLPASVDSDELARRAARIVDLLRRPFLIEGLQVNIGASIGLAIAPRDGDDYESVMKSADLALYSAKAAGRNTFHFFDPEMEARAQERRRLELDLRKALALHQFELQYRPQIDVETNDLIGLKALLRWRHPKRGLLEPDSFMPIAEEIGLVEPIGRWVLDTACREARSWPQPIQLVVAISPPQFASPSLADTLRQALADSSLPPGCLELEITEGTLLATDANVLDILHELRSTGVGIGISNFGTGYASLTKLDQFPFDRIKLDSSLIEANTAAHRAIVSAVVAFGSSLGVSTVLDGIRTEKQLADLKGCNGPFVQGFMSKRPLSAHELGERLKGVGKREVNDGARDGELDRRGYRLAHSGKR